MSLFERDPQEPQVKTPHSGDAGMEKPVREYRDTPLEEAARNKHFDPEGPATVEEGFVAHPLTPEEQARLDEFRRKQQNREATPWRKKKGAQIGAGIVALTTIVGGALLIQDDDAPKSPRPVATSPANPLPSPTESTPSAEIPETFPPLDPNIIEAKVIQTGGENGRQELYSTIATPLEREQLEALVNDDLANALKAESDNANEALNRLYDIDPDEIYRSTSLLQSEVYHGDALNSWRARGTAEEFVKPLNFPTSTDLSGSTIELARKLLTIPHSMDLASLGLHADAYENGADMNDIEFATRLSAMGRSNDLIDYTAADLNGDFIAAELDGTLPVLIEEAKIAATRPLPSIGNAEIIQVRENPFHNSGFIEEGEPTLIEISIWVQSKGEAQMDGYEGKIVTMQLTTAPVEGDAFQGFIVDETYVSSGQGS
ncbi:MAG TPA: hypothetical protein VNI82_00065 [Candidatus Nitrosotenuis sp.]|nr:hypothetical protein [Candidatus Nitrosotenuis sp.]